MYSKILERCTYGKLIEYQKSTFPGPSFHKKSSHLFENTFQNSNLDWKTTYVLTRIATKDSRIRVFQYKFLDNFLYLNKMLFRFVKIYSPLCSYCKMIDETWLYLFYNCTKTKISWGKLKKFISNKILFIPSLTTQSVILGHTELSDDYL